MDEPVWPGDLLKMLELPDLSGNQQRREQTAEPGGSDQDVDCTDESPFVDDKDTGSRSYVSAWSDEHRNWARPLWKIIDAETTEAAYVRQVGRHGFSEDRRLGAVMDVLRSRGEYRRLATIPTNWRDDLRNMERLFPNFLATIDYLRSMYTLAEHGDRVTRLDPMLLVGPPGCGKTYFAEYFARYVGTGCVCLRMENAQNNMQLAGSSEFWSNSKPGEVFNVLLTGSQPFANPVFLLDEIDKVAMGQTDPLSSLLCLLEPQTARTFSDLAYPWIAFDASRIVFICTANEVDKVSGPVLDRLVRFDIALPTEKQARRLVRQIHQDLGNELPAAAMELQLTTKTVESLARRSPRCIKQILREALGRALCRGRKRVLPQDLMIGDGTDAMERRIGFL